MFDGPPESAHCRSCQSCCGGVATWIGGPKVAPPSVLVDTHMVCVSRPEARLWNSRSTMGLPVLASLGPTANHCRSVSAKVCPTLCVQVLPLSSEYAVMKLMPA